ncbi:hypothetical protein RHGRI_022086 [Rhododendron griersonianum]|uniref:Uncharacterized protein n=1 Tax=Rhododendron griersonianum TaxID=479676 RepID=A0AAV6JQQ0_9ERIC|nr:hypothetical protein RHGRI_022086 [Rhododendron griersonianum]
MRLKRISLRSGVSKCFVMRLRRISLRLEMCSGRIQVLCNATQVHLLAPEAPRNASQAHPTSSIWGVRTSVRHLVIVTGQFLWKNLSLVEPQLNCLSMHCMRIYDMVSLYLCMLTYPLFYRRVSL